MQDHEYHDPVHGPKLDKAAKDDSDALRIYNQGKKIAALEREVTRLSGVTRHCPGCEEKARENERLNRLFDEVRDLRDERITGMDGEAIDAILARREGGK